MISIAQAWYRGDPPQTRGSVDDQHHGNLQKKGCTTRLQHYTRYLKAIAVRLDKLEKDPARDRRWLAEWQRAALPWQKVTANARGAWPPFWTEYRWLLEELRVGLFASELKTPMPVSIKRLERLWAQQGG